MKVANPISDLISVPLQSNYDCCYGPEDASRYTLNVQPVIPLRLSDDMRLITRTIIPFISQGETVAGQGGVTGFGDVTQSFFFSPTHAPPGLILGAGPVLLWPIGKAELGTEKFGAGPTVLIARQASGTTMGLLANQIWSYAGDASRADVSLMTLQPFLSHTLPDTTSFTLNSETTYDWHADQWTVPINFMVGHLFKAGEQRFNLQGGVRYYAERPDGGPEWGLRLAVTLLFPE
ncbi:MAG TPA: hypothetical protein VI168_04615 [Croceibacterium sp.]